ncbi:hypothetical protein Vretimale_8318 [Volvox reticuliferus]|uniref:Uncharacterized protein n=1 Tax=Volvox reticuliferus TaxID=1737510 RepID=A0A8J4GBD6_9CHLO|nr:hypothetical protein Vretimale_8318 [Volvox reticuliferus]
MTHGEPPPQHLALSCSCSAGADAEAAVMAALAAAPLASTLVSLELHCGGAFQPELHHLDGLGAALTSLRVYGSRTLDDEALAILPRHTPALVQLMLAEQQSRRGRHIRGQGLAVLRDLPALRALSLVCPEPDAQSMAIALAVLTHLTELDLSRCEPRLLEALAPLSALVVGAGSYGGMLQRLSLPTAYTEKQLERGLPATFGGAAAEDEERQSVAALQSLRLHTSAALPEQIVVAMSRLGSLKELSLSHCGLEGSGAAVAGVAAALTGLTSVQLVQEYSGCGDDGEPSGVEGTTSPTGPNTPDDADGWLRLPHVANVVTWYDGLLAWTSLQQLELTDTYGLDDAHLHEIGRLLCALSHFSLSRNTRATGAGFASWPTGCRRLMTLTLYDCTRVGDDAIAHVAALPLRRLTLAHLPEVGAVGVRRLAEDCTTLQSLTLERLAGAPGAALATLWRLPLLEALCLRMCNVNNLVLETAVLLPKQSAEGRHATAAGDGAAAIRTDSTSPIAPAPLQLTQQSVTMGLSHALAHANITAHVECGKALQPDTAKGCCDSTAMVRQPAGRLTWLELPGCLVSTSGLWALRHLSGLTHLDLSYCLSVGDAVADVLLHGGGRLAGAAAADSAAADSAAATVSTVAGGAGSGRMLLPSLVHIDLRGCMVAESTLERLRRAGLAVDPGIGSWS